MGMTQISVMLPESLQEYVEGRVEHGAFGNPSEYLRSLIQRDREQRLALLEMEMLDALNSGRIEVSQEELTGGNLVAILKTRLTKPVV